MLGNHFPKGHKINVGRVLSKETRAKISAAHVGKVFSKETRVKMRLAKLGKIVPLELRIKLSRANLGKKRSLEQRRAMSERQKGSRAPNWKGGLTTINRIIRNSTVYKEWRGNIFKRDNWKCVLCGSKKNIQADHIKRFADFPELRFDLRNGRTLCLDCHKKTDTYGNKKQRYENIS